VYLLVHRYLLYIIYIYIDKYSKFLVYLIIQYTFILHILYIYR